MCTLEDGCPCSMCAAHGSVIALQAGLGHHIATREDMTVWALYNWSRTPRRKPVRLKHDRDGHLVPVDRGQRGAEVREEMSILYAVGGASRPGRDVDEELPERKAQINSLIDAYVKENEVGVEEAMDAIARQVGYSIDTVRGYRYRRDQPEDQ